MGAQTSKLSSVAAAEAELGEAAAARVRSRVAAIAGDGPSAGVSEQTVGQLLGGLDVSAECFASLCELVHGWLQQGAREEVPKVKVLAPDACVVLAREISHHGSLRDFVAVLLTKNAAGGDSPDSDDGSDFEKSLRKVLGFVLGGDGGKVQRLCQGLVVSACRHGRVDDPSMLSANLVDGWLTRVPSVLDLFAPICANVSGRETEESAGPGLAFSLPQPPQESLLDGCATWMLDRYLPASCRGDWTLLYSARKHGLGFSTLRHHIRDVGNTVVVFRDKQGHVFGGFAAVPWQSNPAFFGSDACFLFTVEPTLGVYPSSGANNNFMFFYQPRGATSASTLPVGLGMGGQMEWFGLWVSDNLRGHSKAVPSCSTYGSPQLSQEQEFEVEDMEAWRVGPAPVVQPPPQDGGFKSSILDGNGADKAILEMSGRKMHSDHLREKSDDNKH